MDLDTLDHESFPVSPERETMPKVRHHLHVGDALNGLAQIPDNSITACVTDPPYELGFMGKTWDQSGIATNVTLWEHIFRVLKPGGHLLSFGATRTHHRMTCAIEDAGLEIRDELNWVYGQAMPHSRQVSVDFDKAEGMKARGARFATAGKMAGMTGTAGAHTAHVATSRLGCARHGIVITRSTPS